MKRLLCIYQHAPTPGAPGIYRHRKLLSELTERSWHVDLISSPINYMQGRVPQSYQGKRYVKEQIDGVTHHWVWASSNLHASRRARAINYATFSTSAFLRGTTLKRPDVIWVSSPPLSIGTLGDILATRFRRPWIYEVRDLWPESAVSVGWLTEESLLYRILYRLARRYAKSADMVLTPSEGLVSRLQGHGATTPEVIGHPVTDRTLDPDLRRKVRADLGVPESACLFLYLGAHGAANGLGALLDAAITLEDPDEIRFVLAGDGSDRQRLETRLREERVAGVELLGAVPKAEVDGLLAASDVCLHMLRPDPLFESVMPTKITEYLAARRPFITTVPGLSQKIAEQSGGAFASTSEDLVRELRRWARMSASERAERGEQGFQYGIERFGLTSLVDKLEKLLTSIIARRSGKLLSG